MSLFRKITETVSKGVSTATEKAQQTVEITRLHAQVSSKRKEIEKLYATMGEAVFEGYLAKDLSKAESAVIPACEEIVAIRAEIEALEQRIMQLRNEKECVCGKKVPYDTRFCPSCGNPFPEPPVQAEPSEPMGDGSSSPHPETIEESMRSDGQEEAPSASDWADVGLPQDGERAPAWSEPGRPASVDPGDEDRARTEAAACPSCGAQVGEAAKFCAACGYPRP
ncbi:zinc-ribbon domain-containing protein [Cohnella sp. CFH 77786]|uniref:zinc ribbon domain-containing protein n=1 Tax=Cohnella sp. CFH 77786 TaxID=2662265 RepID=UPI001C6100BD|nr:zinc ribbon domain-containing protein [Cohnella sp. CFH 77786]MBW5446816.1 zinc-ribbon domain-containing protein [Cohnella sp. CFH 77786]